MRLVDAELVKEYLKRVILGADVKVDRWVDCAPTIDAIPVEWIEDMLREWHKNKAPFEAIGAVSGMLVRWQKEQEAKQFEIHD